MKICEFHDFLFFRKNEKTPETLDFTYVSGGVYGKKHQKKMILQRENRKYKKRCASTTRLRVEALDWRSRGDSNTRPTA